MKKEQEFNKAYQKQLDQWQVEQEEALESCDDGKKQSSIEGITSKADTAIYKERDDDYKIIGNVLQLYANGKNIERRYINKNVKAVQESFDPIRIKLRIMPISRAPNSSGRTAYYYFIQAGKLSLQGDITNAIDMLKRGLELEPNHLLCRFNHGVLMFKMGLIIEAT